MNNDSAPKEKKDDPQTVTNNPEEAIDKPEEVKESNDEKIDEDFPGYPHYPAKDDILNPENHLHRVNIDVEGLSRSHHIPEDYIKSLESDPPGDDYLSIEKEAPGEEDFGSAPGIADVTEEDLALLGDRDEDMDDGDDEELKNRGWKPAAGGDLDIPEDEATMPGMEDEENDYYSLGGDDKEGLEESNEKNNI